ncbi:MAG TPA: PD-(D/E)XK nuclease family protein [Anaerolineae bacterium]|jgi:hypothetical protein
MLDPAFKFSQHSLSDFIECPRRFYLHYVARQPWPLVDADPLKLEPLERQLYLKRGQVLHRWIERFWLGVPAGLADDPELNLWWERFQATDFSALPAIRLPELELVAALDSPDERLLYARFDLLAVENGQAVIIDWKTLRGEHPPRYQVFANRLQTRVYQYVLATAGAAYNEGAPFAPEDISLRYWLAHFPDAPWVNVPYSQAQYARDSQWLSALIADITHREGEAQFELTPDERKCAFCTYRTLCRRENAPTPEPQADVWLDIDAPTELDY